MPLDLSQLGGVTPLNPGRFALAAVDNSAGDFVDVPEGARYVEITLTAASAAYFIAGASTVVVGDVVLESGVAKAHTPQIAANSTIWLDMSGVERLFFLSASGTPAVINGTFYSVVL